MTSKPDDLLGWVDVVAKVNAALSDDLLMLSKSLVMEDEAKALSCNAATIMALTFLTGKEEVRSSVAAAKTTGDLAKVLPISFMLHAA